MDDKNTATTTENNTVTRMQAAVDAVSVECSPAHADRLRAAWAETQELLRGWQAIAAGYQEERNRALDALDRIDTAIDEHKPTGPFAAFVSKTTAAHRSGGALPALLSDVTMGG